ncbi:MAG: peptidylprolyl isomerase [Longimicrobiales bacterium]
MTNPKWTALVAGCTLVAAACGTEPSTENAVARAGGYVLDVDEATALLVDQENLPNQVQVVEALAGLWTDYVLLASAVARDTTMGFLDLEDLVQAQIDQQMIFELRDSVIQVDTAIAEDELRQLYQTQAPGSELRARHILLGFPQGAGQPVRDSVRAAAEAIREQAVSGGDFADLARRYSQDPGTAGQGGDLGFVGRGDLVRPIDQALFAMEVGDISEVVESPFGFHVLRLDERRTPGFEEARNQFRIQVQNRRYLSAESVFVAGVEERADPVMAEGALDILRGLAAEPGQRLTSRARGRALMTFQGGAYTAGEFQTFIQGRPEQERDQIAGATDEQLENFLRGLVQRTLLVDEARDAGLAPPAATVDSLVAETRERLREIADRIGVLRVERAPGEDLEPAVERAVLDALRDILNGAADIVPLGQIAFQLRERQPTALFSEGVGQVVIRVGQARASRSPSPVQSGTPADTAGSPGN